jgi:hypothetical protein
VAARAKCGKRFRSSQRARGYQESKRKVQRRRFDGGPSRRGEVPRQRWRSGGRSARRRLESGHEASTCRCGAGGELGEGQEGAEPWDDGEAERRRWIGLPARRSGGVSMRGWRRASQEALVGCSSAGGARDCRCGAAEVADGGEKRLWRRFGGGAERRRRTEQKCGRVRG